MSISSGEWGYLGVDRGLGGGGWRGIDSRNMCGGPGYDFTRNPISRAG